MKRYTPATFVLALFAVAALAEVPGGIIKTDDKAALTAAIDKEVTVEGKVSAAAWSKSGKVCNIEFEGDPNFVVAVFEKSRPKLDEAFGGDFTKQFNGAVLRVTGKLAAYGGRTPKYKDATQIILTQTGQITVVTPASTQPATRPSAD
ncbi:MAG TPA: hypothetical protein VF595_00135 [Tepidisphaeraceae bacterium]|jgi:DNA/RNA endonuclease YhcR with UshA esterase domain